LARRAPPPLFLFLLLWCLSLPIPISSGHSNNHLHAAGCPRTPRPPASRRLKPLLPLKKPWIVLPKSVISQSGLCIWLPFGSWTWSLQWARRGLSSHGEQEVRDTYNLLYALCSSFCFVLPRNGSINSIREPACCSFHFPIWFVKPVWKENNVLHCNSALFWGVSQTRRITYFVASSYRR
jgi:hypothetical protein